MVTSADKPPMRYAVRGIDDPPQESRAPQPSAPTRMTPPASTTMSAEQSVTWNAWAEALIATRLNAFADALGGECGLIEGRLQKQIAELQKQVTDLRIENAYERGRNAGVVIDLPSTPKSWRRDVA